MKIRQANPSNVSLKSRNRIQRRSETWTVCHAIHGGNNQKPDATIDGMLDTLSAKVRAEILGSKILNGKASIAKAVMRQTEDKFCSKYYESEENKLRSLNVYYSQDVLGKRKCLHIRKANKVKNIPNFIYQN